MGTLNVPFRSEAYDRLMEAQAAFAKPSAVEPVDTGVKLRLARAQLGLTQAALAALLGVDGPFLSKAENGAPDRRTDLAVRYLLLERRA